MDKGLGLTILNPGSLSNDQLFNFSLSSLSNGLPQMTSSRRTLAIYLSPNLSPNHMTLPNFGGQVVDGLYGMQEIMDVQDPKDDLVAEPDRVAPRVLILWP